MTTSTASQTNTNKNANNKNPPSAQDRKAEDPSRQPKDPPTEGTATATAEGERKGAGGRPPDYVAQYSAAQKKIDTYRANIAELEKDLPELKAKAISQIAKKRAELKEEQAALDKLEEDAKSK